MPTLLAVYNYYRADSEVDNSVMMIVKNYVSEVPTPVNTECLIFCRFVTIAQIVIYIGGPLTNYNEYPNLPLHGNTLPGST